MFTHHHRQKPLNFTFMFADTWLISCCEIPKYVHWKSLFLKFFKVVNDWALHSHSWELLPMNLWPAEGSKWFSPTSKKIAASMDRLNLLYTASDCFWLEVVEVLWMGPWSTDSHSPPHSHFSLFYFFFSVAILATVTFADTQTHTQLFFSSSVLAQLTVF